MSLRKLAVLDARGGTWHNQHGDRQAVQHWRHGLAQSQICKEAMPVRAEYQQVELLLLGNAHQLLGRLTETENAFHAQALLAQVVYELLHALAVGPAFLVVRGSSIVVCAESFHHMNGYESSTMPAG